MQLVKPNILIADADVMARKDLSLLIEMEIAPCGIMEADSCLNILNELNKQYYSHLIMDIAFADGTALEILPGLQKKYPALKILFFAMQPPEIDGETLKMYNSSYYLSKTTDNASIVKALKYFLLNSKLSTASNNIINSNTNPGDNPFKNLTPREQQVLYFMLNGFGTKQISETLNLKMNSISTLKKRIYLKTAASNFKILIDLCTLHKVSY